MAAPGAKGLAQADLADALEHGTSVTLAIPMAPTRARRRREQEERVEVVLHGPAQLARIGRAATFQQPGSLGLRARAPWRAIRSTALMRVHRAKAGACSRLAACRALGMIVAPSSEACRRTPASSPITA